eukprot:4732692-Amphidinium_carterae.1
MACRHTSLDAVLSHPELGWTARNQEAVKQKLASLQVHSVVELKTVLRDANRLNDSLRQHGHKAFSVGTLQTLRCVVQEVLETLQMQERWKKQKQKDVDDDSEVQENATSDCSQVVSEETSAVTATLGADIDEEQASTVGTQPETAVGVDLDAIFAYAKFKSPDAVKHKLVSVGVTNMDALGLALVDPP